MAGRIRHHVPTPSGWRDSIVHSALADEWSAP
ncbi:RimJ/RimL family protein N-acetyltransferase [Nonomuraea africana]|uniref:RimJ/RimL family protein N-acetyltransferase n=1 Tax=Nonomuraea africana TaxID=46171 RepID=A0ABR9KAC3_9ACTN|nr:RimJ/RimL family protein N-acetyltransferase [Nonomuraea africana]